jgi:metal transporter CNNM
MAEASTTDYLIVFGLLCCSALFSGLNLGLMSLDIIGLDIVEKSDMNGKDGMYARGLKTLRNQGNFLLCSLLLGNTAVNAVLAVFLGNVAGGFIGTLVTTFLIVIFGEIIPQSICSRHGLAVGYYTRYFTYFFMVILAPIAYAISWVLDRVMGAEIGSVYNRNQIEQLLMAHGADQHGTLMRDEVLIAAGALKFSTTTVAEVMTNMDQVFTLDISDRMDAKTMAMVIEEGYSRVPIEENNDVVTILLIKDLILLNPDDATPIRSLLSQSCCRDPYFTAPDMTLDKMLNVFQKGMSHMAIVRDILPSQPGAKQSFGNIGIVSLEDLVEALIQEDIIDETDDRHHQQDYLEHYGRYRKFKLTPGDEHTILSEKEVQAVAHWLTNNNPAMFSKEIISERRLAMFVRHSAPIVCMPPAEGQPDQFLWQRGDNIDFCFLVLSEGPIQVMTSQQGFTTEVGAWNLLGAQCLSSGESGFVVDFSLKLTHPVRLLKFSRAVYRTSVGMSNEVVEGGGDRDRDGRYLARKVPKKLFSVGGRTSRSVSIASPSEERKGHKSDVVLKIHTSSEEIRKKSISVVGNAPNLLLKPSAAQTAVPQPKTAPQPK